MEKKLSSIRFTYQSPPYVRPLMRENKTQDYITWGNDNRYPEMLHDIFMGSTLNKSIILRKLSEIVGKGLYSQLDKNNINKFIKCCNAQNESLDDVFYKCVRDYLVYGGFCLQVVYTRASERIAEVYHKNIRRFRFTPDQMQIKEAQNWNLSRVSTITHNVYNSVDPSGRKLFYYRGNLTEDVYPEPEYSGAISAIQADILIADFWLSQIKNGLYPGLHVNFNEGPQPDEVQDALERDLQDKFGGNAQAGRIFITFGDAGNPGPTITPIEQPDLDKKFVALNDSIQSKIFQGHGLPPVLLGVPTPGKLGATNEVTQAAQQFRNNTVEPLQQRLLNVFNKILEQNFNEPDLAIVPLKPIGNVIDDQVLIASQLTQNELRKLFVEYGYIETVDIPEGDRVIGISDLHPAPNKTNDDTLPDNRIITPDETVNAGPLADDESIKDENTNTDDQKTISTENLD
jgi:hypothetical protein